MLSAEEAQKRPSIVNLLNGGLPCDTTMTISLEPSKSLAFGTSWQSSVNGYSSSWSQRCSSLPQRSASP